MTKAKEVRDDTMMMVTVREDHHGNEFESETFDER
jgi:hypothetical protein